MKAIPTVYRGIQMRSRLEAKWACYFDLREDCEWEYEPLDFQGWIPDFSLYLHGDPKLKLPVSMEKPFLIEVKPVAQIDQFIDSEDGRKVLRAIKFDLTQSDSLMRSFHSVVILGVSYKHVWYLGPTGWQSVPQTIPNAKALWNRACNKTQWKAPR